MENIEISFMWGAGGAQSMFSLGISFKSDATFLARYVMER